MKDLAALLGVLAWPLLLAGVAWFLRHYIIAALDAGRRQLASGARLKWKDFEFEGVNLLDFNNGVPGYRTEPATKDDLARRSIPYRELKNLFLVHRAVPSGVINEKAKLPSYDVLVKLVPHKHYGKTNDIKRVDYYFGKHFGSETSENGVKYIVEDGTNGFAIRIDAYGPTLCEAHIHFHDGSAAYCSRYLDFEGTGYVYEANLVEQADKRRVRRKVLPKPEAGSAA